MHFAKESPLSLFSFQEFENTLSFSQSSDLIMTKQFLSLIFLSLFSHAVHAAWSEFGRSRPLEDSAGWTRKRIRGWEQAVSKTTPDESRHDVVVQSLLRE